MVFSSFDKRLLAAGTDFFTQPRLASLLETLGTNQAERAAVLATMLRNSCPEELEEAVNLFERGLIRAARRQLRRQSLDRRRDRIAQSRNA
jgi:hypothetical protein